MAEGLALAASVIAVLQLTNSVVSVCYDYAAAASGSSWELTQVTADLESLRGVLQRLEPLAKQVQFARNRSDKVLPAFAGLCKPNGPLEVCLKEIQQLERKLKSPAWAEGFGPKSKALVQSLRWPLKSKDTEKTLLQINRCKDILSLALRADHT